MPFKDTPDGQTHSYNDGCGEPAHNQTPEQIKQEILTDLRTRGWENAEQVDAYFETALDRMAEVTVAQERNRIWHEHLGLGKPIREVLSQ